MGKIVQKVKFLPIGKNSNLSQNHILLVKMSPKMCSISKTEPQKHVYQNGKHIGAKRLTSKNEFFNRSLFRNLKQQWTYDIKMRRDMVSDSDLES